MFTEPGAPPAAVAGALAPWTAALEVLDQAPIPLPVSGNLRRGKTGAFLFLTGGHDYNGTTGEAAKFFSDIGTGTLPSIAAPVPGEFPFLCGERVE